MNTLPVDFHFLRPAWLLLLPLCLLLIWGLKRYHRQGSVWRHVVDPHLLPWLTTALAGVRYRYALTLLTLVWTLAVIALAGPVWEKLPQPVFKAEAVRLLVLDLSRSMDARDIRPSRLVRARHKVLDILHNIREGQVGLIVFAGQPHVVSPLTDDAATIAAMVPVLNTGIMPVQGSSLLSAMQQAKTLLDQSGVARADIIVISDDVDDLFAVDFAKTLKQASYRVSVLAVGTLEGAPIPAREGGFIKDDNGGIVVATLGAPLRDIAKLGGGIYTELTIDDSDIRRLLELSEPENLKEWAKDEPKRQSDIWREVGVYLLLPLLLAAALAFRRGWLLSVVLAVNLLPVETARADWWDELWHNDDQRGMQAWQEQRFGDAAGIFTDPQWQAAARYRQEEYDQALKLLQQNNDSESHYNRGNVLARLGRVTDAIAAYEQALDRNPAHRDAAHNKRLLEQFVRRARQQNQQQQPGGKPQDSPQSQSGQGQQDNPAGAGPQQSGTNQGQQGQDDKGAKDGGEGRDGGGEQSDDGAVADGGDPGQKQKGEQRQDPGTEQQQASTQRRPGDGADSERQQAIEQWLGRIPDDPGGLLERKFRMQYERRGGARNDNGDKW